MLDVYPIITYINFIVLLHITTIKTQMCVVGLTCGNRRLVRLNAWVLIPDQRAPNSEGA